MEILYSILIFYLGAIFAAFAHVLGVRLPKKEIITGKSYCDFCRTSLRLIDVLPIFGYIINRGKCYKCKNKISIIYPLVEIIGGILFLISYLLIKEFNWELFLVFTLITVLLIESISDIYHQIVIDSVWMIGAFIIAGIRLIQGEFLDYLLSAVILFAVLILLALLGKAIFKKEALGGGDIKLFILIGFSLTIYQGLLALFLSAVIGLIVALIYQIKPGKEMPFVPMISLATIICFWFGSDIISWYLNLLGM